MLGSATKLQTARKITLSGAVSGNANFDGSGNVTINTTQGNIAIIDGVITLAANTTDNVIKDPVQTTFTSKEIDFPTGYNKNNCIVLSVMFRYANSTTSDRGYACGWSNYPDSADNTRRTLPWTVNLGSNTSSSKFTLRCANMSTSESTTGYRIILLKIA